jgi:signal transduction histidine kinase
MFLLLAVMGAGTVLELVSPQDDTFGGVPLLCVVAALWLLPAWPALVIGVAAMIQPVVLLEIGQWPALTADFQFIAVAVVTVIGTVTVNALVRAATEREALIDGLTRFTADAAHELRSPLSAIRNTAEVTLQRSRTPARYVASLEQIRDQATRLAVLTDGLLLLARRDASALYVRRVALSLDDIMEELHERWRSPAERAKVTLEVDCESGAELSGDPVLLGRLFDNLVDNALRQAKSRITVSTRLDGSRCLVSVEDDGGGFPTGQRPATVDQVGSGATFPARSGGTGLGLRIAAAVAAEHGGTIGLEHFDGGLRVVVRLPVTPSQGSVRSRPSPLGHEHVDTAQEPGDPAQLDVPPASGGGPRSP